MYFCRKTELRGFCCALALLAFAPLAQAQQVVLGAPELIPLPNEPMTVSPGDNYESSGFGSDIGATSLAAPSVDAAGLANASALGLSNEMWQGTSGEDAIAMLEGAVPSRYNSVNQLLRRALVASATPPDNADGLLAARAEALIRFGAAEQAASLSSAGGLATDDRLAEVAASAALIVGREEALCTQVAGEERAGQRFWDTVRAYCLANSDDPLASVAIGAMTELGRIDPENVLMLEAIVDEALSDFVVIPAASTLDAPRIAMLRRLGRASAVVERAPLPMIAGLFALESTGARGALIAAEKLEAAGAIPTDVLRDLYADLASETDETPLGIRAKAIRDVLAKPSAVALGESLMRAAREGGVGGFAQAARVLAPTASKLPPASAGGLGAAGYAIRDALLLGGFPREAGIWSDAQGTKTPLEEADTAALMAVADPNWPGQWRREWGETLRGKARDGDEHARRALGALAGFAIAPRPKMEADGYLAAAEAGRTAEAVFGIAEALEAENPVQAATMDRVVRTLRAAGLEQDARRIAIEAMIVARWL